jgi:Flp pilus assembly protein TadB
LRIARPIERFLPIVRELSLHSTLNKWYRALEGAGVEFIGEDPAADRGQGVRMRQQQQARRQEEVNQHGRTIMNANVYLIVVVVLVVLSVILAIMDRSFLSPMYLLVLALVVMVGTSVKFPW